MAVKFMSISARVSAAALAFATLSLPAAAHAQWQEPGRQVTEADLPARQERAEPRAQARPSRSDSGWSRPAAPSGGDWTPPARADFPRQAPVAAPPAPVMTQGQAAEAASRGNWDRGAARGERQEGWNGNREGWSRNRDGDGQGDRWNGVARRPSAPVAAPAPAAPPAATPVPQARTWSDRGSWSRGDDNRRRDGDDRWRRDRDGSGWSRDGRNWRDGRSDDRRWDNDRRGDDRSWSRDRNWNRDGHRWDSRSRYGYGHDYRRWDNRWRDNRRYDWYSYRRSYPNTYRLPSYYAPYRNYSYRRLSIGFYLDSLFFSSRYYINDPWQYRLPDVYGPYRWVRYYDDALLVNVYTGEVVDVIYSFFW